VTGKLLSTVWLTETPSKEHGTRSLVVDQ
jgi:hypothetical protein